MNLKKVVIRASSGQTVNGVAPPPIDASLQNYCAKLATKPPTLLPASGKAKLDLVQLHLAINLKVALANDPAFKVALEAPWQHEVDAQHPDHWIKTYPIALMFSVAFNAGTTTQYLSISFGDDVHVPDP